MNDLIRKQLTDAQATMDKAIVHCESELTKIRAGKASKISVKSDSGIGLVAINDDHEILDGR